MDDAEFDGGNITGAKPATEQVQTGVHAGCTDVQQLAIDVSFLHGHKLSA